MAKQLQDETRSCQKQENMILSSFRLAQDIIDSAVGERTKRIERQR